MKTLIIKAALISSIVLSGCASIENSLFNMGLSVERSLSSLDRKEVQVGQQNWVYLEANAGEGKPTVVLLHGFAAEKDNWVRMVRSMDDYHMVAPDLPGHGESSFSKDDYYGFDQQSLRVAEFIDAMGLQSFHLVGNSMGGAIAALYTYRHQNKVKSLTLMDAVGFYGSEQSDVEKILEANESNPLIVRSREGFDTLIEYATHQPPFMPWPAGNVLARRAMEREQANDHIFEHIFKEAQAAKYAGGFKHIFEKINVPTYVVWGDQDRVLHVSSVEQFFMHMPNVRVDVIPQIGHAPMLEVPAQTSAMLQEFWSSISSSNSSIATN